MKLNITNEEPLTHYLKILTESLKIIDQLTINYGTVIREQLTLLQHDCIVWVVDFKRLQANLL